MRKFINLITKKEIKEGEYFKATINDAGKLCECVSKYKIMLNDFTIPILLEYDLIKEITEDNNTKNNKAEIQQKDINIYSHYIDVIAEKWNKTFSYTEDYLKDLYTLYPTALESILYRVLSIQKAESKNITLDDIIKQYVFYGISPIDKTVVEIPKDYYTSTKTGAFFATVTDATKARNTVNTMMEIIKKKLSEQKN